MNVQSCEGGLNIRGVSLQANFSVINTILAVLIMFLPLLCFAFEPPIEDLLSSADLTSEGYKKLTFEPEPDELPHNISRRKIDEIKKRHKKARCKGTVFHVPELAVTVRNMKEHLASLKQKNVFLSEWDVSGLEQKLACLESENYPYRKTLITCYQFTQVVEFIYNRYFHEKISPLLKNRSSIGHDHFCFVSGDITVHGYEIGYRYLYPVGFFRSNMTLEGIVGWDFSKRNSWNTRVVAYNYRDEELIPHNVLLDALHKDVFLFPTYEVLTRQDFLRILAGRDVFFLGLIPAPVAFFDHKFMSLGTVMDHDLEHTIMILKLIQEKANPEKVKYYEQSFEQGFYQWNTFSKYNKNPVILRAGLKSELLNSFSQDMYNTIDKYHQECSLPAKVKRAIEVIHFDILHENPLPYNALLEFTWKDIEEIISFFTEDLSGAPYSEDEAAVIPHLNEAGRRILEARDKFLQEYYGVAAYPAHRPNARRSQTHSAAFGQNGRGTKLLLTERNNRTKVFSVTGSRTRRISIQ